MLVAGDAAPRDIDAARALAILRVAQERPAVVHGDAQAVRVEREVLEVGVTMCVRDDGSGLSAERLARATGGLDNAVQWLREHGGALDLDAASAGGWVTSLRARLPLSEV